MDGILNFIAEKWPLVFIIIIVVIFVSKYKDFMHSFSRTVAKIDALPCETHKKHIDNMYDGYNKLDNILLSIRKIEARIIKYDMDSMDMYLRDQYFEKHREIDTTDFDFDSNQSLTF